MIEDVFFAADQMLELLRKMYKRAILSETEKQNMVFICRQYKAKLAQYREQQQAKAPKQASLL